MSIIKRTAAGAVNATGFPNDRQVSELMGVNPAVRQKWEQEREQAEQRPSAKKAHRQQLRQQRAAQGGSVFDAALGMVDKVNQANLTAAAHQRAEEGMMEESTTRTTKRRMTDQERRERDRQRQDDGMSL